MRLDPAGLPHHVEAPQSTTRPNAVSPGRVVGFFPTVQFGIHCSGRHGELGSVSPAQGHWGAYGPGDQPATGTGLWGRPRRRMDLSRSPSSIRSGLAARTQLLTWRCTAGQTTEGLEERNLWLSNSWLLRHRCSIVASTLRWVLSRACTALPVRSSECS
jgi:hypothetical protein